jgi:hypothetical protein
MRTVLTLLALLLLALPASAGEVQPAEGVVLRQTHVEFRWEIGCSGYQLAVVEDDGSADPFEGADPVADVRVVGLEPRAVVTSGLAFDKRYAWRVRGRHGNGASGNGPWGPTRRFEIAPLPEALPSWIVSEPVPARLQPGLTILDILGFGMVDPGALRAVAVDRSGAPVWFNQPVSSSTDTRQLRDGTISYVDTFSGIVTTLEGEIVWISPVDPALAVHHEMFPMPNGNFLALVFDDRTVEIDGQPEEVFGERIVEFDRETKEIVWEWSTFDHYSLEDMPPFHLDHGHWIHGNAVVYNERDNSVYLSSRSLSRITRIDYDTGEIIYNMGKQLLSGDVDFGDGLFHAQHAPELLRNGNMLLHNNGTCCDAPNFISSAIELKFDNPDHPTSASIVWEYVLPNFSPAIGDADRLPNGNTLIASGVAFGPGVVYEVTRKGELAWKLEVEEPYFFYRAERIPELVVRSKRAQLLALREAVDQAATCRRENQLR